MNEAQGDDIVYELKKGNSRALTSIFNLYYDALCFFAERMVVSREEAQDIVEETFIKLWHLHGNFQTMQNVKAFLYITTRNACLNFLRQSERANQHQQDMAYALGGNDEHVLSEITRTEVLREVHAAIESLPPQCRKIVRMSFVDGLKNHEIAEQLSLSVHTVKNQKVRAIYLLKIKLLNRNAWLLLLLHYHLSDKN